MQLANTCGSFLVSLSFLANHGNIPARVDSSRYLRAEKYMQNFDADDVFKEAEELISELPAHPSLKQPPPSTRHDTISLDPDYSSSEQSHSKGIWPMKSIESRKIQNIIETSLGLNYRDRNASSSSSAPIQSTQKKRTYGAGRPLSMKIWMNIGTNDLITRCKRAKKFLEDGIPVMFKIEGEGASSNYLTHAQLIVNTAMSVLSSVAKLGGGIQQHANFLSQIFNPIHKPKQKGTDKKVASDDGLKRPSRDRYEGFIDAIENPTSCEPHDSNSGQFYSGRIDLSENSSEKQEERERNFAEKVVSPESDDDVASPIGDVNEGECITPVLQHRGIDQSKNIEPGRYMILDKTTSKHDDGNIKLDQTSRPSVIHDNEVPDDAPKGLYTKPGSKQAKEGYWMDVNAKCKQEKMAKSKFITLEKRPEEKMAVGSKATIKNDMILQRFMSMRKETMPKALDVSQMTRGVTPARIMPPSVSIATQMPVAQPVIKKYEAPKHAPLAQQYAAPYETPSSYNNAQWSPPNQFYGSSHAKPYSHKSSWSNPPGKRVVTARKAVVTPKPSVTTPKQGSAPTSRWMILDKNQT